MNLEEKSCYGFDQYCYIKLEKTLQVEISHVVQFSHWLSVLTRYKKKHNGMLF